MGERYCTIAGATATARSGRPGAGLAIRRVHSPRRAGKHNVTAGAAAITGERYCTIAGSAVTARSGRRGAGHAIRRCHSPSLAGKHHPAASATLRYLQCSSYLDPIEMALAKLKAL